MITTHVTDAGRGVAAARVPVQLDAFVTGHGWHEVGRGVTNDEGFVLGFDEPASSGLYRLMFDIAAYSPEYFFPSVTVAFEVKDAAELNHIPLVLSPFGYSVHKEG